MSAARLPPVAVATWIVIVCYAIGALLVGSAIRQRPAPHAHYVTTSDVRENHRLSPGDVVAQPAFMQSQTEDVAQFTGHYARAALKAGSPIAPADVTARPNFVARASQSLVWVPLAVAKPGDAASIDSGTIVDVCAPSAKTCLRETVGAVACMDATKPPPPCAAGIWVADNDRDRLASIVEPHVYIRYGTR